MKLIRLALLILATTIHLGCEGKKEIFHEQNPPTTSKAPETTTAKSQANKAQPFVASLERLYIMATFFSEAMTVHLKDPQVLQTQFCGIESEQITLYSMAIKSRIDEWIKNHSATDLPSIHQCAESCMCSFYIDIDQSLVPNSKQRNDLTKTARSLLKKENTKNCIKTLSNFCESPEFKELQTEVTSN